MHKLYKLRLWIKSQSLSYHLVNHIFSRKLIKYYRKSASSEEKIKRTEQVVIYMADGKMRHGGLCDRIWGMVSVYDFFHKQNGVTFQIYFKHPYPLTDYLLPNTYNWLISSHPTRIRGVGKPCVVVDSLKRKNVELAFERILHSRNPEKHIYTNVHYDSNRFCELFHELFKPSSLLQEQIDKEIAKLPNKYISVSFRFRNVFGDFNEPNSQPLSKQHQDKLIKECISQIVRIHILNPAYKKILLTCDSSIFIKHASKLGYVYIVPGHISHIDFSPEKHSQEDSSQLKTFLDLFLISKAESVYYVISKDTYHGSFAYTAAKIGNRPYNLISIQE